MRRKRTCSCPMTMPVSLSIPRYIFPNDLLMSRPPSHFGPGTQLGSGTRNAFCPSKPYQEGLLRLNHGNEARDISDGSEQVPSRMEREG